MIKLHPGDGSPPIEVTGVLVDLRLKHAIDYLLQLDGEALVTLDAIVQPDGTIDYVLRGNTPGA